jgi:hypothetical protein
MTQCILSHILVDHHYQLNRYRLELFYNDCLEKDELLDEFTKVQEENNIYRRQINRNNYHDPYTPLRKSKNLYIDPESSFSVPLQMQFHGQSRLSSLLHNEPEEEFYIDNGDIVRQRKPMKLIAEESIMSN